MIDKLRAGKNNEYSYLLEFLENNHDYDFYFTKDNARIYMTDVGSLKSFIRSCMHVYVMKERGDYKGIILVWKSIGGDKTRYYVKVNAVNEKVVRDLLTVLLWNFNEELFIKIRKDSKFVNTFKEKGFRFMGVRGIQILLNRKPLDKPETRPYIKREDYEDANNERYFNNRDSSKTFNRGYK